MVKSETSKFPARIRRREYRLLTVRDINDRRLSTRNPEAGLIYRRVGIVNITAGALRSRSIGHVQRCFHFLVNAHHNRHNGPYPRLLSGWYQVTFSVFSGIA